MTSRRRRPDRPIRSVSLRIAFRGTREEVAAARKAIPSAVVRGREGRARVDSLEPAEVAEEARVILERLKDSRKVGRL